MKTVGIIGGIGPELLIDKLRSAEYEIFCADINGGEIERQISVNSGIALVIGSEARGLNPSFNDRICRRIKVAMSANTESLNAAVAGSILMYRLSNITGAP